MSESERVGGYVCNRDSIYASTTGTPCCSRSPSSRGISMSIGIDM